MLFEIFLLLLLLEVSKTGRNYSENSMFSPKFYMNDNDYRFGMSLGWFIMQQWTKS